MKEKPNRRSSKGANKDSQGAHQPVSQFDVSNPDIDVEVFDDADDFGAEMDDHCQTEREQE